MRIAAIDQGTTSTRVLVVQEDGSAEIRHSVRHQQRYPRPGWVEHDPIELLNNVRACIEAAEEVDAIGMANQGESCLAWDRHTGEPLSPVLVWQDDRTNGIVARMRSEGSEALTLERACLPLDSYFSASKLAWIVQNNTAAAEAYRKGRLRIGTSDSFFLDRLTGEFATDVTTAARTSLLNLAGQEWDSELCRLFGVPMECLPEIRPTVASFGTTNGIPVCASIVDQQAALYGHGCREPGDSKITFGTGAFMLGISGSQVLSAPESGLLPTPAWKIDEATTFALDGGVFHAGAAFEWAARAGIIDNFNELEVFESEAAIARGLGFVPALAGLACPHWDRDAGALWIGISPSTSRRDLCQSILEGVALRTAEIISAMSHHLPLRAQIYIDGGLSASSYFAQFLADVSRHEIVAKTSIDLTAFGCAGLAALGIGQFLAMPRTGRHYLPGNVDYQSWISRFSDAVARSKRWR